MILELSAMITSPKAVIYNKAYLLALNVVDLKFVMKFLTNEKPGVLAGVADSAVRLHGSTGTGQLAQHHVE